MAIITAGYDGTVDETQFAELIHRYSVVGPDDFKATTQAGDRIVAISDGVALGPGTRDVATSIPPIQFAVASGTRWDLVVLRRDWQPPGGATSVVIVQGGSVKGFPAVGTAGTNWNRRPGIVDDQPLYLQEVNGTLLGARIDLRCWASHGGVYAQDVMVREYLDRVGAEANINGVLWRLQLTNGVKQWVSNSPQIDVGQGDNQPYFKGLEVLAPTNAFSVGFIVFTTPFPNICTSISITNSTSSLTGLTFRIINRTAGSVEFVAYKADDTGLGAAGLYVNYVAVGY